MFEDAEIIRRSLAEPRAFEAVFDRHFPAIHRYVRHCLGADAAEDLSAETFLRAFAARERYRSSTPDARAWLFGIAANLVRDEVRRRGRADGLGRRLSSERIAEHIAAELPDPELHAALMTLREAEREVLLLFAWAELSYEEIAEVTGTPIGTVRSRLSRARTRLREALGAPSLTTGGCHDG